MKTRLLLCIAILLSFSAYSQNFTDGDTYYHLQYDNAASDSSCLANTIAANHGGQAFGGGNVDMVGYSDMGSPDAIYFIGTPGSINPAVTPYYYDIYFTNGNLCDPMSKGGGTPHTVGIDLSGSKKVFVTAKAASPTAIEFFIATGVNGAFPLTGTYSWASTTKTINLTTSYATYELDWAGITEFETWAGRTKVNLWGIRMSATNDEVYVQTIDFGVPNDAPTASITSPAANDEFDEGIDITINADAADTDGSVAKVEFYYGAVKIGEDLTSPYSITWSGAPAGTHSLTVVATDDLGATTTSAAVSVDVNVVAGITNSSKGKHISLYPNPSNGDVAIKTSGREGQIVITNTQGVVVGTLQVKGQQDVYQINSLEKGIYVVKFTSVETSTTERLIVQ